MLETSTPRALLFTGHMIDAPDRTRKRFPPDAERSARDAISKAIHAQMARYPRLEPILAAAACGGDILFHEACHHFGLATEVVLALAPEEFRATSVSFAGPDWNRRFDEVLATGSVHVLDGGASPDVWGQANQWMVDEAMSSGAGLTLLALWDGVAGDGTGGTSDFVGLVRDNGGEVIVLDTSVLFGD